MKLYKFLVGFIKYFVFLLFRVKIVGKDIGEKDKPMLVCANHISMWDPVFVACVCKRPVHFMAKSSLFRKRFSNWFFLKLGAFPVNRETSDIAAIKKTLALLKGTDRVGIFLQGSRKMGVDMEDTDVKSGVGMILSHTEVDTLPISIVTKDNRVKLFRKVYICIGDIIPYEKIKAAEKTKESYKEVSEKVFEVICENAKSFE